MFGSDRSSATKKKKKKYLILDCCLILVLGIDVPADTPENDGAGAVSQHIRHLLSTREKF